MSRIKNENPELSFVVKEAVKAELMQTRVCLPARIVSYDPATQNASVEPLIKKEYIKDDELLNLPIINNVPVLTLGAVGGDAFIHFPLKAGDTGIIIICDRSLDIWLSGSGQIIDPKDTRIHDINDSVFIPGLRPFPGAINGLNSDDYSLGFGDSIITFKPNGDIEIDSSAATKINSIGDVEITAPNIKGTAAVKAEITAPNIDLTGIVTITGAVNITGAVQVNGAINASGNIIDGASNTNHHSH